MTDFVSGIVEIITMLFAGLIEVLGSLGTLVFSVGETGSISGLTPFGWLAVILVAIPLTTWIFNKGIGLFKMIFKK